MNKILQDSGIQLFWKKDTHTYTHFTFFFFFVSIEIGSRFAEYILSCSVLSLTASTAIAVLPVLAQPDEIILPWHGKIHFAMSSDALILQNYVLSKDVLGIAIISARGQLYLYELTYPCRRCSVSSRGLAQALQHDSVLSHCRFHPLPLGLPCLTWDGSVNSKIV